MNKTQLLGLFAAAGIILRSALRTSKSPAERFGLSDPKVDNEILLDAMVANPTLVNRPILFAPRGVRLCGPSDTVLKMLEFQENRNFYTGSSWIIKRGRYSGLGRLAQFIILQTI